MAAPEPTNADTEPAQDALSLLRNRSYLALLVFGAIVGVPAAALSLAFLKIVDKGQHVMFVTLPEALGFAAPPVWWPLPILALGGLLTALAIQALPGSGGHSPARGFTSSGPVLPAELPGIALAAIASLALGAVVGPEAPLIAIGSGLGVLCVHLVKKDAPRQAVVVIGAAGSFAAISTLLGSPLLGAFLLMEAVGIGGPMLGVVMAPGLLAAGIGSLVFVGLGQWTGWGTLSLAVPDIPAFTSPDVAQFAWAIVIGLLAAVLGTGIRRLALALEPLVQQHRILLTPLAGLGVGLAAVAYGTLTDGAVSDVLFSGEDTLGPLLQHASVWTAGGLVAKSIAYGLSLSAFRGGPTFPGMIIGAAGGIALSHLPGLPPIAGAAMGIGAMSVVMLGGMPLTSVLLVAVVLEADQLSLLPLVIVAVIVSYVAATHLGGGPARPVEPAPASAARRVGSSG
jgi:H+/Cl- antiporter ClcA